MVRFQIPIANDRRNAPRCEIAGPRLHHRSRGFFRSRPLAVFVAIIQDVLTRLGLWRSNSGASYGEWIEAPAGGELPSYNPADGLELARVQMAAEEDYDEILWQAARAFERWR